MPWGIIIGGEELHNNHQFDRAKLQADLDTLQAVITHRYAVLTSYARSLKQAYVVEAASLRERAQRGELTSGVPSLRRLRDWFHADQAQLPELDRARLASTLEHSKSLHTLYAMRQELTALPDGSGQGHFDRAGREGRYLG